MIVNAKSLGYQELNEKIRETSEHDIIIEDCIGQRYIGAGLSGKTITIHGTPENALAASAHLPKPPQSITQYPQGNSHHQNDKVLPQGQDQSNHHD